MTETEQYRREDGEHITIIDYATVSDIATNSSSSSKSSRTAAHAGYRQTWAAEQQAINIVIARTAEQGHETTSTSPPGPPESQTRGLL